MRLLPGLPRLARIAPTIELHSGSAAPSDWWDVNPLSRTQNPQNPQNDTMELGSGDSGYGSAPEDRLPSDNTYRLEHRTPQTPETPRESVEGNAAASGIGAGVSSHEVGNIDGNTETAEQAAAGPNAAAGVSGVPRALEQNFDAHTSEPRRTNPPGTELFIDDAPALDEPVGMSKGEVFFGLQCGFTGKRCDLCRGIPCAGSIPVDGVSR